MDATTKYFRKIDRQRRPKIVTVFEGDDQPAATPRPIQRVLTTQEITDRLRDLRDMWAEVADGEAGDFLTVYARVSMVLADVAQVLDLTDEQKRHALGDEVMDHITGGAQ